MINSLEFSVPSKHSQPESAVIRQIRRIGIAVFAMVVVFCFGTSQAQASCGDYLHHHGMMPSDASGLPKGYQQKENFPQKMPCQGPSCRQRQQDLPAPIPIVSFEAPDRWMLSVNFGLSPLDQSSFLPRLNESVASMTDVFRLDRPPKA